MALIVGLEAEAILYNGISCLIRKTLAELFDFFILIK